MRKKKPKMKKIYHKLTFWLGVLVVGVALGSVIQFTRAWVEPSATAPNGNVAAPVNTGWAPQTKVGDPANHGGVTADICVDPNGDGDKKCLSNAGSGDLPTCVCKVQTGGGFGTCTTSVTRNCGGESSIVYSSSTSHAIPGNSTCGVFGEYSFPCFPPHTSSDCTNLKGANNISDAQEETLSGEKVCHIKYSTPQAGCPSGWKKYGNWSATTANTCNDCSSCTTGSHASWGNIATETCPYQASILGEGGGGRFCIISATCSALYNQIACY